MIALRRKNRLRDAADHDDVDKRLTEAERRTSRLETRVKRIELEVGVISRAQRRDEGAAGA